MNCSVYECPECRLRNIRYYLHSLFVSLQHLKLNAILSRSHWGEIEFFCSFFSEIVSFAVSASFVLFADLMVPTDRQKTVCVPGVVCPSCLRMISCVDCLCLRCCYLLFLCLMWWHFVERHMSDTGF